MGMSGMPCIHPLKDMNEKAKEKKKKQKKVCHTGRSWPKVLSACFSNSFSNVIFQLDKLMLWSYHF